MEGSLSLREVSTVDFAEGVTDRMFSILDAGEVGLTAWWYLIFENLR